MATYPYLVQIAWDVLNTFLQDWQSQPYYWSKEIDVQVEIATRLSNVLRIFGRDRVLANYRNAVAGFEKNQLWSRVTCEPPVKYTFKDGKEYICRPDVVVWDDIEDPNRPPDEEGKNFPILWACEVKYGSDSESDWDLQKLRFLVSQGAMRFGCWVRMELVRASAGNGLRWQRDVEDGRVWVCDAQLPAQV